MAQRTMPQNEATNKQHSTHNGFPMSYAVATTQRYGDIDPFFYIHTVGGDKIPLQSSHELRSHTLASPLLSGLQMHKEYYEIPMRAILPNTWEYIFANPTQGDDVPNGSNNPYCSVPATNFNYLLDYLTSYVFKVQDFYTLLENQQFDFDLITDYFKSLFLLNKFFSNGELLSKFGYRLTDNLIFNNPNFSRFDSFFNIFLKEFSAKTICVVYPGENINSSFIYDGAKIGPSNIPSDNTSINFVSFRKLIEIVSSDPSYLYFAILAENNNWSVRDFFTFYKTNVIEKYDYNDFYSFIYVSKPFDFSLLASYQLVCAHFYTNDHVDFIYSANLLRNLFRSYINPLINVDDYDVRLDFDYNGMSIQYDSFSGYFFNKMILALSNSSFYLMSDTLRNSVYGYFYSLFSTCNSLKFGDYFTGARPYPLAVGDVNVEVNNSEVSAIDITRKIQLQRFLNNVNRTYRKFSDYIHSLTDGKALPTPTDPKWLASQHYNIGGNEIENTSNEQGNIVLNLRSQQSKYSLEYRDSEPSIVIGLCWFDALRLYSKSNDRHFFREDRFDFFNKDMQYIGDQDIYACELNNNALSQSGTFAYTLRNMEDKQRVSIATGGFVEALPSWAFVCDYDNLQVNSLAKISPEFIRSSNAEFDRFYKSLTRFDSAGYFHFIIYHYNQCHPVRPMAFAPSIL